jgi:hypothetical protein
MVLHQLAARIVPPSSGPLTIRGAAAGRVRRNAISLNGEKVLPGTRMAIGKPLEVWRRFVQHRWDPQLRFLNLEVGTTSSHLTHVHSYFEQRMAEDETISRAGLLPPGMPGSTGKEAAVIFKLASQLKPPVSSCPSLLMSFSHPFRSAQFLSPTTAFKAPMSSRQSPTTYPISPIFPSRTIICAY